MKVKIYTCFIASPSDTSQEREICSQVINRLNSTLGNTLGFRVEPIKWEENARPGFGEDGQDVINGQLLDEFDLFIGIMSTKFGSPTGRAGSGTEEEFNIAYKNLTDGADLDIFFYFNDPSVSISSIDIEQLKKVKDFQKNVINKGGLYWSYKTPEQFKDDLYKHLYSYFEKKHNGVDVEATSNRVASLDAVKLILTNRLNEVLSLFSNQPRLWILPVLSSTSNITSCPNDNFENKITVDELIENGESVFIQAPPQFGLTCLAHFLILEAWNKGELWIYIDAKKAHRDNLTKFVKKEITLLGLVDSVPKCIVLDSWINTESGSKKQVRNLCKEFPDSRIIVMQTIDDSDFRKEEPNEKFNREFVKVHLLALPRNQVREVVSGYNSVINIGDDEVVLKKVINDLDALNIHRTPLNCITLLKVSEGYFNESPVNRTKMIEMVLFVLFNLDGLPTYKVKPDLKDCEYVLGRLCEKMILAKLYSFSREVFLSDLQCFCEEKLLSLDVTVVFDVLHANNIIIQYDGSFKFRSTYWIYYFVAKRMYSSESFKNFILSEQNYISFPEVIEFYTGIDRERSDVLDLLSKDLARASAKVLEKTGLDIDLNPLKVAKWSPSKDTIQLMEELVNEDVQKSKLPDVLKDNYADKNYDQLKPYDQNVHHILHDYSLTVLFQKIKACSRALRNSDYVEPDLKREALKQITLAWRQVSTVIFALTPLLAVKGEVAFEGQMFYLSDEFSTDVDTRINQILQANPLNVVNFFRNDLFSMKLGPLLFDALMVVDDELIKHELILLLCIERPRKWKQHVEEYIKGLSKDSFYLLDISRKLTGSYRFDFADQTEIAEIKHLVKLAAAKHEFGEKSNMSQTKQFSNIKLPERKVQEEK